jgi:hypothetical protein
MIIIPFGVLVVILLIGALGRVFGWWDDRAV